MTPSELATLTKVLGPVVREFTAKAVAEELAPVLARNAELEQRLLELETRPEPAAGPAGPRGEKGDSGAGVASLLVSADERLVALMTDGRSVDAGPVPRGTIGAPGAKGDTGDRGEVGPMGPVGPIGQRGATGDPGIPGAIGPVGPAGPSGERGEKGLDGAPGPTGAPGDVGLSGKDGAPGERGLQGDRGLDGQPGRDGRDGAAGLPGATGEKGLDGRNGADGRDGLDGLGFDDYGCDLDETRGWVFRLGQGGRVKEWEFGVPFDKKVWAAGETYPKGAGTTWDGHWWIALKQTTQQPGEGSPDWRLAVRRGKQGREGKPGKEGAAGRDLTQIDPATGRKW